MTKCDDCPAVAQVGRTRCLRCGLRKARKARQAYWRAKLARVRAKVGRAV